MESPTQQATVDTRSTVGLEARSPAIDSLPLAPEVFRTTPDP